MRNVDLHTDLCVVGGGMAGITTAISAARRGVKVVLIQDRPVLGGNASSECRMWICGAPGQNPLYRETGILEEIELENFIYNETLNYSMWDQVLYGKVKYQEGITLLLNTVCQQADMDGSTIRSVSGYQLTTETYYTVYAKYYADCSGDSVLAPLTGASFRQGREARGEYNESIAPITADSCTMGISCLFQVREDTRPHKFVPPAWAHKYTSKDCFPERLVHIDTNWWWIELGGTKNCIDDAESIKDELLRIAMGVWDYVKNYSDLNADNYLLDWVGFLPAKRESRRYIGDYVVTQNDVESGGLFDDVVAYGGWKMDDHFPEGFDYPAYPTVYHPAPCPWGIPYRALYSKDIDNLYCAGRNISVTHSALSSSRVMATCASIGQAVGTAVAIAIQDGVGKREVDIAKLQQYLIQDDCYIPNIDRVLSPLTISADTIYPALKDGVDRDLPDISTGATVEIGDSLTYTWQSCVYAKSLTLVWDSNLTRRIHNMPCVYHLDNPSSAVPSTLVKSYEVRITTKDGEKTIYSTLDNRLRHVTIDIAEDISSVSVIPLSTYGNNDKCRLISMYVD